MSEGKPKGLIAWWASNPVAANLLMVIIISVGLLSGINIKRTMMPEFDIPYVQVTMAYPGAAPEEVELGIVLKIEEAITDLDNIKRVSSSSMESVARIFIEPEEEDKVIELINDVKTRIDAIPHFPDSAEKPIVGRVELPIQALMLQISGDLDERAMKELGEQVKLELLAHPDISSVAIWGARDYEIAIEISDHRLREYHLTLGQVADIVAASSIDLPGGSVRTESGDILLRTRGQAYRQADFEQIVLKTFPDGTRLLLGDIATVEDGFEDRIGFSSFDNEYSIGLAISALGAQDILSAASAAKEYAAQKNATLPDNVRLTIWNDFSYYLNDRLGMMMKNLTIGALVVFVVLALFLEVKLAFWVMVGIPICFFGSIAVFGSPWLGGTLNIVSAFAFIVVLGIVVDDAIIIGESAYTEVENRGPGIDAVVAGAKRVATPATFGVLTTIAAFMPTLFIDGGLAVFGEAIGFVVVFCLLFSLVESKWILPAHLAHSTPTTAGPLVAINRVQKAVNRRLKHFVENSYRPFVERCIHHRYVTVALFLSGLILTAGFIGGGQVRVVWAPEFEGESISMQLVMTDGTSQQRTLETMQGIGAVLHEIDREYQVETEGRERLVRHVFAWGVGRTEANLHVEMTRAQNRAIGAKEVMARWREKVGEIPGAEVFSLSADDGGGGFGPDISLDMAHPDWGQLQAAAEELEARLKEYDGLFDVQSDISAVSDEFHFDILPEGENLGLTRFDLGSQIRHAFYGAEAQRVQRDNHEIKVMVRYPAEDRRSTASLDSMFIRTRQGDAVPFNSVASMEVKPGFSRTSRINYRRAVEVTSEANIQAVEPGRVLGELVGEFLPELQKKYPGLEYSISGMSEEEKKLADSMTIGFVLALFAIYSLLAIPTKSYMQPLIIMGVIPFGIIGAVLGHIFTGYAISMMSVVGIIALSGVVVNDSLIMVDYVNRMMKEGMSRTEAAVAAGTRRFRAIVLTSLTTFSALMPMLLESSLQAKVIIPMAVSLSFGIVFATVITLVLVPCLYVIVDDLGETTDAEESPALGSDDLGSREALTS